MNRAIPRQFSFFVQQDLFFDNGQSFYPRSSVKHLISLQKLPVRKPFLNPQMSHPRITKVGRTEFPRNLFSLSEFTDTTNNKSKQEQKKKAKFHILFQRNIEGHISDRLPQTNYKRRTSILTWHNILDFYPLHRYAITDCKGSKNLKEGES